LLQINKVTMRFLIVLAALVSAAYASRLDIGCFADGFLSPSEYVFQVDSPYMTNRICSDLCREAYYQFSATTKGSECYCANNYGTGNRFARYGKRGDNKCSEPCSGLVSGASDEQNCGNSAGTRYSVYSTGLWYSGCWNYFSSDPVYNNYDLVAAFPSGSRDNPYDCVEICSSRCYADEQYIFAALTSTGYCYCGNSLTSQYSNRADEDYCVDNYYNDYCYNYNYYCNYDSYYYDYDYCYDYYYQYASYCDTVRIYHTLEFLPTSQEYYNSNYNPYYYCYDYCYYHQDYYYSSYYCSSYNYYNY